MPENIAYIETLYMIDFKNQFFTPWFHCICVNGLDILIVNDTGSVVGINRSNCELDLFKWIVC